MTESDVKGDPGKNKEAFRERFPYESRYFNVGPGCLHYIDEGTGPVLLLMHACPMWSYSFRHIIAEYSKCYRVIAIDQMGFGLSDKPEHCDYRLEGHVDNLENFIRKLELKDIVFIMHGRGATIGTAFATRHPELIRGFVILNSMAFSEYSLPLRLQICRIPWIGAKLIMRLNFFTRDLGKMPPQIIADYLYPYKNLNDYLPLLRFIEDIPCMPEDDSARIMYEIESSMWLLREKPGCIIWAQKDWLYRNKYLERWKKYLPRAEVHMLKNAGRNVLEDSPDEISYLIARFLEKLDQKQKNGSSRTAGQSGALI